MSVAPAASPRTLRECREGDRVRIVAVGGAGAFKRRLMEMGFLPGTLVAVQKYAPLRDPIEFVVKNYHVSLRRAEAALVTVEAVGDVAGDRA
ncbi:MAG: ferrous iron transport protein A [Deltaproteobacteria bacterium]|nr:ferrous iron transport protein A [Deltaproteobacteria bacterium]